MLLGSHITVCLNIGDEDKASMIPAGEVLLRVLFFSILCKFNIYMSSGVMYG